MVYRQISVFSSSHETWDRGHEGKDLELSSEVFLVSPAPHDLIGSDIREITPFNIVTLAATGLGLQGHSTRHVASLRHHKELPAGPHRG